MHLAVPSIRPSLHAMASTARLVGRSIRPSLSLRDPARLIPAGICAFVMVAVLFGGLPFAGARPAGTSPDATGHAGPASPTVSNEPAPTALPSPGGPELVFQNALEEPVGGWPRDGFLSYVTKAGDSLAGIAAVYRLSVPCLYFANEGLLGSPKKALKPDMTLTIPPIDGHIVVVGSGETLTQIADQYKVAAELVVQANALTTPEVAAGQMIVVPGAWPGNLPGAPGAAGGTKYMGGDFWWPVNGPWHISQWYSRSAHPAIDIAAAKFTPVVAAAGGRVVKAGFLSKIEGGNVIWIAVNGGWYITYNHLATWSVHWGETVHAGQVIGEVGMSGITTGPHLHFEVWRGYPWRDGTNDTALNPCRFLPEC